mmetsp:Transcript_56298/g.155822  ORF Transcript_56298/g.155822 Transcript_56298/m.155822 type:complete len:289 (-) Transcript_56298:68-934(-)
MPGFAHRLLVAVPFVGVSLVLQGCMPALFTGDLSCSRRSLTKPCSGNCTRDVRCGCGKFSAKYRGCLNSMEEDGTIGDSHDEDDFCRKYIAEHEGDPDKGCMRAEQVSGPPGDDMATSRYASRSPMPAERRDGALRPADWPADADHDLPPLSDRAAYDGSAAGGYRASDAFPPAEDSARAVPTPFGEEFDDSAAPTPFGRPRAEHEAVRAHDHRQQIVRREAGDPGPQHRMGPRADAHPAHAWHYGALDADGAESVGRVGAHEAQAPQPSQGQAPPKPPDEHAAPQGD